MKQSQILINKKISRIYTRKKSNFPISFSKNSEIRQKKISGQKNT
jgi:hypothetical protein